MGPRCMTSLLGFVTVCSALYSLACLLAIARTLRAVRKLSDLDREPPARWPRVSLTVPARDEAANLEAAIVARLGDGYPDLELIVVDDRPSDGIAAIADAIAARDARVVVEHITSLPDGSLGKVHALQRGVARASGEWLLFSDADVHFAPGTLCRAISYLESEQADHLRVMPEMRRVSSFGEGRATRSLPCALGGACVCPRRNGCASEYPNPPAESARRSQRTVR